MKASLWRIPAPFKTSSGPPRDNTTVSSILTPSISIPKAGIVAAPASSNATKTILIIITFFILKELQGLKHAGSSHAGSDTHGYHAIFFPMPAHAVHQRGCPHGT